MTTGIDSNIEKFHTLATQLAEQLEEADSFRWVQGIGSQTIDLELARQSWQPSRNSKNEPAFLILEACKQTPKPQYDAPVLNRLNALVHGQLVGQVTRLAVMFYRQPHEPTCKEELLSITEQGKHSEFHPEIFRQKALQTLQHWIDFVVESNRK